MTNEQRQINQMLQNGILESHRHVDTILTQICHLPALLHTTFTTMVWNMVSNVHKKSHKLQAYNKTGNIRTT